MPRTAAGKSPASIRIIGALRHVPVSVVPTSPSLFSADSLRSTLRVPPWWPVVLPSVLALLALSAWLRLRGLDPAVFRAVNAWGAHVPQLWAGLSVIGLGLSAFLFMAAAAPGSSPRRLQRVAVLLWCFPIGGALTHGFKQLFSTPRPQAVLPLDQMHVIGEPLMHFSLPSGHSITAMAVIWLWLHIRRSGWAVKLAVIGVGIGVMVSRMTTAAHWPSDVAAGAAAGWLAAQMSLMLTRRWSAAQWLSRPIGQVVLGLGQIGGGVSMAMAHTGYPEGLWAQWLVAAVGVLGGLDRLVRLWTGRAAPQPW